MRPAVLRPLRQALFLSLFAVALTGCPRSKASGEEGKPGGVAPPTTIAPPAAPTVAVGTYTMHMEAQDDPNLILERVTVDQASTKLDFTFTNKGKNATNITIAQPGDKYTLFLEWAPGKKAFLVRSTGIAMKPANNKVGSGQSVSFSLIFDALEPGVRKFDMYEGEDAKKTMPGQSTYWIVRNIELK